MGRGSAGEGGGENRDCGDGDCRPVGSGVT